MAIESFNEKMAKPFLPFFWASVFLAIALVAVKASYVLLSTFWDWATPMDYFSGLYLFWAAAASRADLLFAIGVALMGGIASRMSALYPKAYRATLIAYVGSGVLCVVYAIVARQIFAYFGSQLTAQLFTLGGDFAQMRDSIFPYLTPPALTGLIAIPFFYVLATRAMWRISRTWTARRVNLVYGIAIGAVALWLLLGQKLSGSTWFEAQDRYVVESPQWVMLTSLMPEAASAKSDLLVRSTVKTTAF